MTAGEPITRTLTLAAPAPAGGVTIPLQVNTTGGGAPAGADSPTGDFVLAAVEAPEAISIPEGQTSATVTIQTDGVTGTTVTIALTPAA